MKSIAEDIKKHPVRWCCRLLAPLMMAVIFYFSSRPGPDSDMDSLGIGLLLGGMMPGFDDLDMAKQLEFAIKINKAVRKTAHFLEYACLAVLLTGACDGDGKKKRKIFLTAVVLAAIYAASDEFHQTFVPGRSGKISDVLIDSSGAAFGSGIACILLKLREKKAFKNG